MRRHAPPAHAHAPKKSRKSGPTIPAPSHAERARTLVALSSVGSLSTWSKHQPGFPFGSIMPYAEDDLGRPVFLISALAMHTQNLVGDPRASLLIAETRTDKDVLGAGRVTLQGEATKVPDDELAAIRELYLDRHANASYWVDYRDFAFYRLDAAAVYFVGGFGVMGWVEADEYGAARRDPLAFDAPELIRSWNEDHVAALVDLGRRRGGEAFAGEEASEARITAVDRLGFHLRMKVDGRFRGGRIAFSEAVADAEEARSALSELLDGS